jgi:hypothetical protein
MLITEKYYHKFSIKVLELKYLQILKLKFFINYQLRIILFFNIKTNEKIAYTVRIRNFDEFIMKLPNYKTNFQQNF